MNPDYSNFEVFRSEVKRASGLRVTFDLMLKRIPNNEREEFIQGLYFGIEFPVLIHNFSSLMEIKKRYQLTAQTIYNFCSTLSCTCACNQVRPTDFYDLDEILKKYQHL